MSGLDAFSLHLAPLLPLWALAGLAGVAGLLLGVALWRRARGTAWRSAACLILFAALLGPVLVQEKRDGRPDIAVVVVDESASQTMAGRAAQRDRALAAVQQQARALPNLELRVVRAGVEAGRLLSEDGTRLFEALDRALADIPRRRFAGAILLTDGQVHDVPSAAAAAKLYPGPVHGLLTGNPRDGDRRLVVLRAPTFGLVDKPVTFSLKIDDPTASGSAILSIHQDGGAGTTQRVPLNQPFEIQVPITHGGANVVELAVEPGAEELTLVNNRAVLSTGGIRDRLKVLLVSGEPHAGERTWRNLLKADPAVDLIHFTILRPAEKQDGTPIHELSLIAFPVRPLFEDKIKEFDLIIFDRYKRQNIIPRIYLESIVRYIEEGGAIFDAAGPTYATALSLYRSPLGEILPAEPTGRVLTGGFRPALTPTGQRHPVTADLPGAAVAGREAAWGHWYRLIEAQPRRGQVVMSGAGGEALLVLDRVGKGRVAQLLSDHVWLWSRGYDGGGPQAELLRRTAHWLMKEPQLEEEDLSGEVRGGKLEITRRSLTPGAASVTVTAPDGATQTVPLRDNPDGRARGSVPITTQGLYRISDGTQTALAAAGRLNPLEYADLRAAAEPLKPVAGATGGGLLWLNRTPPGLRQIDASRLAPGDPAFGRDWIALKANHDYDVTGVASLPLMPGWLALILLLGSLILGWRREGK